MRTALSKLLTLLVISACVSTQPVPLNLTQTETIARLEQQVATLERRIEVQAQQLAELNAQLAAARAREAELEQEVQALNRRVEDLNAALAEAQASAGSAAQFEALNNEVTQSQTELRAMRKRAANTERTLQSARTQNQELLQELDEVHAELARIQGPTATPAVPDSVVSGAPQPAVMPPALQPAPTQSGSDDAYVELDPDAPIQMELFYGTNRQPLTPATSRYFTPFVIPLLLLTLLITIPRAIRYLFRDRHHRVSINLVRVAFIVALVYVIPAGIQKTMLRWQADHSLTVQYGPKRMLEPVDGERYVVGKATVSIPPLHLAGNVELPDLMHFEFSSDPKKHFVLAAINPMVSSEYYAELKQRVALSREPSLFVFVHGFHNTFQDAAFRTAQIAHDMNFPGVPVFFSWPSQGKVLDYTTDENNVGEAVSHLTDFLEKLRTESGATSIHVIAHSMGSRALIAAVKEIGSNHAGPVFNEMVLAAPDIDAGLFINLAPGLVSATDRVTLYASSKDQALTASRQVHGGDYPRAGESLPTPVVVLKVDSIDVSAVSGGHSYIADSGRILDDLNNILLYRRELNTDIAEELLDRNGYKYWKLK